MIILVPVKLKDEHEIKQHVMLLLFRWDSGPWGIAFAFVSSLQSRGLLPPYVT